MTKFILLKGKSFDWMQRFVDDIALGATTADDDFYVVKWAEESYYNDRLSGLPRSQFRIRLAGPVPAWGEEKIIRREAMDSPTLCLVQTEPDAETGEEREVLSWTWPFLSYATDLPRGTSPQPRHFKERKHGELVYKPAVV